MNKHPFTFAICHLPFAMLLLLARPALAQTITAGPSLTNANISTESNVATSGTTVQFTLDGCEQAEVDFFDSSSNKIATIIKNVTSSCTSQQSVFWGAQWLIGSDLGRHDGTFSYQVTPSTGSNTGTPLPATGDPSSFFTITSVDIHSLVVKPSVSATGAATFPYTISYDLAKAANVTATIANSSNTVVRTLLNNQQQAAESVSTITVTWNGLSDLGNPVPIGVYTLTLNASDPAIAGSSATTRTQTIVVQSLAGAPGDPQALFESNTYVYPNPVRNGQGTFQLEAIRDGANLSLRIYTITGTLVLEQKYYGLSAGTVETFPWTVTNQAGNKLGRGLYYYVVREDDSVGTLQTVKKMAILP